MLGTHALEERRVVAAVVQQDGIFDFLQEGEKFCPDPTFVGPAIRPKALLYHDIILGLDPDSDEVVEILVGRTLHVEKDRRPIQLEFKTAKDVDFSLTNGEGL